MAKPLLRDLWMDTACQHVRRMAVTQIMKADPRQCSAHYEARELVRQAVRLQRLAVCLSYDVHIIRLPDA